MRVLGEFEASELSQYIAYTEQSARSPNTRALRRMFCDNRLVCLSVPVSKNTRMNYGKHAYKRTY